jgi:hypothetical protein
MTTAALAPPGANEARKLAADDGWTAAAAGV